MGFGGLGIGETIFIVVVALLIFGPRRLPELGGALGKGIREFRRSVNEVKHEINSLPQPERAPDRTSGAPARNAPSDAVGANSILPPKDTVVTDSVRPADEAVPEPARPTVVNTPPAVEEPRQS